MHIMQQLGTNTCLITRLTYMESLKSDLLVNKDNEQTLIST